MFPDPWISVHVYSYSGRPSCYPDSIIVLLGNIWHCNHFLVKLRSCYNQRQTPPVNLPSFLQIAVTGSADAVLQGSHFGSLGGGWLLILASTRAKSTPYAGSHSGEIIAKGWQIFSTFAFKYNVGYLTVFPIEALKSDHTKSHILDPYRALRNTHRPCSWSTGERHVVSWDKMNMLRSMILSFTQCSQVAAETTAHVLKIWENCQLNM